MIEFWRFDTKDKCVALCGLLAGLSPKKESTTALNCTLAVVFLSSL